MCRLSMGRTRRAGSESIVPSSMALASGIDWRTAGGASVDRWLGYGGIVVGLIFSFVADGSVERYTKMALAHATSVAS